MGTGGDSSKMVNGPGDASVVSSLALSDPVVATPLQAGMLFHAVANPGTGVDVEQISIRLQEPLDVDRFAAAWQLVFERHPILSARFAWRDSPEPLLHLDRVDDVVISIQDWSSYDDDETERLIAETATADRLTDFNLESGPISRFLLAGLTTDSWWFLWSFHHSVLDGRSFPILLEEVFLLYDKGLDHPLPQRTPFQDYARFLEDQNLDDAKAYWTTKLAGVEAASSVRSPEMPTIDSVSAPSVDFISLDLDRERTDRLRSLASRANASLNTCVQAAWYLTLLHYTQQPTVVFGTTRACRHSVDGSADMVGLLINTVPMVVEVDRTESVLQLLGRLRAEQTELRRHETTPLPVINACATDWSGPLLESIVVFDDASLDARMASAFPDNAASRRFRYDGQTNFPLTLLAYGDPEMSVRLEYAVDRYSTDDAHLLLGHFLNLLDGLGNDVDRPAVEVQYLTEPELARYDTWNATEDADYLLETTLMAMFEQQVEVTPDAPALVFDNEVLSYDQFNRRANRLAHHLRGRGVGPESMVGVFTERSFEMMVAIYAVLKAGGAYVPLDPEHPAERLGFMVDDSGVELVLTQSHLVEAIVDIDVEKLSLDDPDLVLANSDDGNPPASAGPDNMAYLLYTSGSTGRPKGVMIEHRSIVNRLVWMQEAYGLNAADCVLQKTPYTFDVSVWELFWPLQVGARLVMAKPGGHRDTAYLAEAIERHSVTTLHFVPSMLQLFVEEPTIGRCQTVKRVICSGEALPRSLQDRVFDVLSTELHNLYGPTEAAVDVTWWACDADSPLDTVPIGYPIANTEVHVLDPDLRRLPIGVPGELHIGGVQVARGYHNRQELTAEKFVTDPYGKRPGARLYRTGDLVRYRSDGAVEFLGRIDHQIKIRGQRVELGEIEAVIADHLSIKETVVVADGSGPADTRLVAYVVSNAEGDTDTDTGTNTDTDSKGGDREISHDTLEKMMRDHCMVSLAPFMVPTVWVFMSALPLNANGKVDRGRLPKPESTTSREIIEAGSKTEAKIVGAWQELLGDVKVGVTETFFDVGGDSLMLIRLAQMLTQQFQTSVTVPQLLRHSTIRQQAELIAGQDQIEDAAVAAGAAAAERRRAKRGSRQRTRPRQ